MTVSLAPGSIDVSGWTVAVIPFPALGDATIYLRLAQTLSRAGAHVCFFSDMLASSADLFDWVKILPLAPYDIAEISAGHDLLVADVLAPRVVAFDNGPGKLADLPNLLAVTAKHFPPRFKPPLLPRLLATTRAQIVHTPFCPRGKEGFSMVESVDRYLEEVFGLAAPPKHVRVRAPTAGQADDDARRRVLIFPTTPNPSKNFSLKGFRRLSLMLSNQGWKTEIICMPHEEKEMSSAFPAGTVRSFPTIRELILHVQCSAVVVSNDSGGGHLASMLGLRTFTITKKRRNFVWRPGFNENNAVISPIFTLKWFSGRVWRPFIPFWRIANALGKAPK